MFTSKDIAEYYNTTQNHYQKWWNLKSSLSLHYGIWENEVSNFQEALVKTNEVMMTLANVSENEKVLDAGCGVGGAAFYLHKHKNAEVTGVTLSEKQLKLAQELNTSEKVNFKLMDYTKTSFYDETFDVVWACESMTSAPEKELFIEEAFRILKKGGRLIVADYFLTKNSKSDLINKWIETWGISNLITSTNFSELTQKQGFESCKTYDYTQKIQKSAKRMYYAALLGAVPSIVYNLLHPNVSRFAKSHYKSGYFQYKALQKKLWKYNIILAVK